MLNTLSQRYTSVKGRHDETSAAEPFAIHRDLGVTTDGSLGIVPVDLLSETRSRQEIDLMSMGQLPALLLLTVALIWRTAHF